MAENKAIERKHTTEKMNAQQVAFVRAYVRNGAKGEAAAREAGYSHDSARTYSWELLTKPHILAAIHAEQARVIQGEAATEALDVLRAIVRDASTPPATRVTGAQFLLRLAGHVEPKAPESVDAGRRDLADMTVDELEQIVRDGRKAEQAFERADDVIIEGEAQVIDMVALSHSGSGRSAPQRDATSTQVIDNTE